jgi:hypothetical protein
MSFDVNEGKTMTLKGLYERKANRIARIEMLKSEIRTIDRIILEKEKELNQE